MSLPSGYKEVEYLICYGNQYLNVGDFFTANGDILDCAVALSSTAETSEEGFWGVQNAYELYFENNKIYDYYGVTLTSPTDGTSISRDTKIDIHARISTSADFYWGCYRPNKYNFYGRLYKLTVTRNSSTVFQITPCYRTSDNKPGFYEVINDKFYINAGSSEFGVGPDVGPTPTSYTVQFNDGSGNTATQNIETGVATALETPFAKRDHALIGWDTSSAGVTVVYTPGQTVTDIAQAGQTIDLYAVWRKSWAYILMDDNGDYYSVTQSGATQTLVPLSGISTLTAAVFYTQGFQFLPNNTILQSLSDPTVYLWGADPWTFMDGEVNAVPYPQEIKTEVDLSAAHIIGIDEFLISYTGNVNVGYTYDGSTPATTMTAAAFLALDPDNIYAGLTSTKKLYVFFYLQDENAVLTRFTVNYKRRKFH